MHFLTGPDGKLVGKLSFHLLYVTLGHPFLSILVVFWILSAIPRRQLNVNALYLIVESHKVYKFD